MAKPTTITIFILLILEQFCAPIETALVGEVIKRTLHRQEPQTPIPSFLSENGRALPRKIQSNSDSSVDWLHGYKALLEQWSQERLQKEAEAKEIGAGDSDADSSWPQSPTVVNKFVSPDTKAVSYLISAAKTPPTTTISTTLLPASSTTSTAITSTKTQRPWRPSTSIVYETATTTPPATSTTQESTSRSPTTTLLFTTVKNAIAASKIENEVAEPKEGEEDGLGSLISPNMAKGAAIFLTSLLGTFLPTFDSTHSPASDDARSGPNIIEGPPAEVRTGYAQVARYHR